MKLLKLKYKLIAIILAVTFISLFIYVGYVTLENVQRLRSEMKDNIMTIARVTGQNVVPELSFFDRDAAQETLGHLSTIPIIENAVLYNETGELYAQYNAPGAAAIENRPLKYGSQLEDGYFIHYEKIIFSGKWYGSILLKVSTDQLNEKIWESIIEVLVFMVFLSIVIFLLSWRLQRYISDPILLLADSFKEVSKKRDYSLQVEKTSQDEIGSLYDGFNEMMDQIQMHQQELREHKGNLENLVSQRTEEIRKKNIQLTRAKEMAENANRLKSQFLANMSHEIRTPMNAILGFTNILLEDEIDSEKQYFLETVKKSGESLLKLINDILDFSKIEADRFEITKVVFSLRKLFYHLEMMFSVKAQEKNLYLTINGLKELPDYVLGDSQKLNQVLINIVANAFKFTHTGGVTINCWYESADQNLVVSIKDTGIGISEEKQEVIFNPFTQADGSTTREYGGTGLGLSIALRMVKLLGGVLDLDSDRRRGTTFAITLPLPESEPIEDTAGVAYKEEDKSFRGKTIAIIEDNPGDRELLKTVLGKNEYRVVELSNAPDIVRQVVDQKVELVILDIVLDGLTGFEINDLLKKDIRTAHIPVIVYSGSDKIMESLASGIVDYIKKPIRREEVLKRIYINLKMYDQIKNIFLVDDDEVLLNLYCNYLHRHKYNCFAFGSGEEALEKIREGVEPDLIILDLVMPKMDGFRFLKQLRNKIKRPDIPVIIITAKELSRREMTKLTKRTLAVYAKGTDVEMKFIGFLNNYFKRKRATGQELVQRWLKNVEDDEQIRRLLMEAIESLPEKISELESAIFNHDTANIGFISHSLKGMSLSLDMIEVGELCREINDETRKKKENMDKIGRLFIELKELVSSIPMDYFHKKPGLKEVKTADDDLKILVAEDDRINQKLIKIYFKRMGRKCDIADNGLVALEMMKKQKYHILFLDIQMPVMDGMETIKRIRQDDRIKDLHVIALTAHALKGDQEKYIKAGCDDYISKPVKVEALVDRINAFLNASDS